MRADNCIRRKGVMILVKNTLRAKIIRLMADTTGRFVKIMLKDPITKCQRTVSSVYLEPNAEMETLIPDTVLQSDLVAGDMNSAHGVYHYRNMEITNKITLPHSISDHPILVFQASSLPFAE